MLFFSNAQILTPLVLVVYGGQDVPGVADSDAHIIVQPNAEPGGGTAKGHEFADQIGCLMGRNNLQMDLKIGFVH